MYKMHRTGALTKILLINWPTTQNRLREKRNQIFYFVYSINILDIIQESYKLPFVDTSSEARFQTIESVKEFRFCSKFYWRNIITKYWAVYMCASFHQKLLKPFQCPIVLKFSILLLIWELFFLKCQSLVFWSQF